MVKSYGNLGFPNKSPFLKDVTKLNNKFQYFKLPNRQKVGLKMNANTNKRSGNNGRNEQHVTQMKEEIAAATIARQQKRKTDEHLPLNANGIRKFRKKYSWSVVKASLRKAIEIVLSGNSQNSETQREQFLMRARLWAEENGHNVGLVKEQMKQIRVMASEIAGAQKYSWGDLQRAYECARKAIKKAEQLDRLHTGCSVKVRNMVADVVGFHVEGLVEKILDFVKNADDYALTDEEILSLSEDLQKAEAVAVLSDNAKIRDLVRDTATMLAVYYVERATICWSEFGLSLEYIARAIKAAEMVGQKGFSNKISDALDRISTKGYPTGDALGDCVGSKMTCGRGQPVAV